MSKNTYINFCINLSKQQLEKVIKAAEKGTKVVIGLKKNNLMGNQMLPLTQTQINRINKSKNGIVLRLSAAQLKHCKKLGDKTGGILPLLALLPLIFGGLGAAEKIAGGVASAVSSAKNSKVSDASFAEAIRHNREVESQLKGSMKSGSGILSNIAGKIPVFGALLKLGLEKLGFGIYLDPHGRSLYLDPQANGFYLNTQGSGLFLDPRPRKFHLRSLSRTSKIFNL